MRVDLADVAYALETVLNRAEIAYGLRQAILTDTIGSMLSIVDSHEMDNLNRRQANRRENILATMAMDDRLKAI